MDLNPNDYISPRALATVPELHYQALLDGLLADLAPGPGAPPASRADAFARFGLLAQSTLGGLCGPHGPALIRELSWGQVAPALARPPGEALWLTRRHGRLYYPLYLAPPVGFALALLVEKAMAGRPTRHRALGSLATDERLAPPDCSARQLVGLQQSYLARLAVRCGLPYRPTLAEFRACGRWLLTRVYPLDVLHALLGLLPASAPLPAQLEQAHAAALLESVRQPWNGDTPC
ncbi:MAG: hypothetical protein EPO32_01530 [Anaerolineae bacterium]|nr:MAG: hypothetical protein EPO32_01530 [Anaerolineae bacterium]